MRVFECERDSVQRAQVFARRAGLRDCLIGGVGLRAGPLGAELDDCVERWVDCRDSIEVDVDQFARGDLARADGAGHV